MLPDRVGFGPSVPVLDKSKQGLHLGLAVVEASLRRFLFDPGVPEVLGDQAGNHVAQMRFEVMVCPIQCVLRSGASWMAGLFNHLALPVRSGGRVSCRSTRVPSLPGSCRSV